MDAISQGWYPDPTDRTQLRYWDGVTWTARAMDKTEPEVVSERRGPRPWFVPLAIIAVLLVAWSAAELTFLRVDGPRSRAIGSLQYAVDDTGNALGADVAACVVDGLHTHHIPYDILARGDQLSTRRQALYDRAVQHCRLEHPTP